MKQHYSPYFFALLISPSAFAASTAYNPQISLILDGRYSDYSNNPEDYNLAGFQAAEESGLEPAGFAIGESELTLSSNIDDHFSGQITLAFADEAAEVEEAYARSTAIGNGVTVKFGRFLSSFGYINSHHPHSWSFADTPLMYRALFGGSLKDDGVQLNYVLPTDLFMQISTEALSGNAFPAGANAEGGIGATSLSLTLGDDIGTDHSWQMGLSHWQANNIAERIDANENTFSGNSKIDALNAVYKWSPNGNSRERNLKLQAEYFKRTEDGNVIDATSSNTSTYSGDQNGWYAQAVYQFIPRWRSGVRIDRLNAENTGNQLSVLDDVGLLSNGYAAQRTSLMLEWLPSEFSRLRVQFNNDQSVDTSTDRQLFVQYTFSLGAHNAHAF
jgi:hypothetical protein